MPRSLRSKRHKRLVELLAQYRREADLKQSEVAEALGRHQPFVANIESGQRRVHIIELLELADVLQFDPHELLAELMKTPKR
jgi:transcriptional regulator with XRE-family HTH domain